MVKLSILQFPWIRQENWLGMIRKIFIQGQVEFP